VILAAGLSPAWQQILVFDYLQPGEVNRGREVHWCASGKVLNVGLALHHLGADCRTLTLLGGPPRAEIEREFAGLGAPLESVECHTSTRICTTILERESGRTTELVENAGPAAPEELAAFIEAYARLAAEANLVVLTGSLPSGVPAGFYRELLSRTPGRAILDVRGEELLAALELRPLVAKPNREELGRTFGRDLSSDEALLQAMHELNDRGAEWAVVTEGRHAVWATSAGAVYRAEPPQVSVVNPIGCGDCLAAGLAWAIELGEPMPGALRLGIAAAVENALHLLPARLDPAAVRMLVGRVSLHKD
jgi:1-phosphofructokinase family hexose kinase